MGCCGGGTRKIKSQPIKPQKERGKKTAVHHRIKKSIPKSVRQVNVARQYIVPQSVCTECGYPMMLVNISGRERRRCSNVNCRNIQ